jgi:hypothetical protein
MLEAKQDAQQDAQRNQITMIVGGLASLLQSYLKQSKPSSEDATGTPIEDDEDDSE